MTIGTEKRIALRREVDDQRHLEVAHTVLRPANRIPGSTTDPDRAAAPASSGNDGPDRRWSHPPGPRQKLFGIAGRRPYRPGRQHRHPVPPSDPDAAPS